MSMYIGEALFGDGNEIAHIDLLIGSKDGPVGIAFANDIRATPTYMVNGVTVDPGDGTSLEKYVAGLLKK